MKKIIFNEGQLNRFTKKQIIELFLAQQEQLQKQTTQLEELNRKFDLTMNSSPCHGQTVLRRKQRNLIMIVIGNTDLPITVKYCIGCFNLVKYRKTNDLLYWIRIYNMLY